MFVEKLWTYDKLEVIIRAIGLEPKFTRNFRTCEPSDLWHFELLTLQTRDLVPSSDPDKRRRLYKMTQSTRKKNGPIANHQTAQQDGSAERKDSTTVKVRDSAGPSFVVRHGSICLKKPIPNLVHNRIYLYSWLDHKSGAHDQYSSLTYRCVYY